MTSAVLIAALLALAPNQTAHADAERSVAAVEERYEAALVARDREALDAVLAEGFIFVHSIDGRIDSRTVFLDLAARGAALSRQRGETSTFDRTLALHGPTAIRTARIRTRFQTEGREMWLQQIRVFVSDGKAWRLAAVQGTTIYNGAPTDPQLYSRYAGTYVIDAQRSLVLEWDGNSLMATLPSGTRSQVFLKSPTEEANAAQGRLYFVLDATGNPTAVRMVTGTVENWRAERKK